MGNKIFWERWLENLPVKILAVGVALGLLLFHRLETLGSREFTLPVALDVDSSFMPLESGPFSVKVSLRGEKKDLDSLTPENLRVLGRTGALGGEGPAVIPLVPQFTGVAEGIVGVDILLEPGSLRLHMERKESRIMEVHPQVVGRPAPGFLLTGVEVQPLQATLVGPRSKIEALELLQSEKIDITGLSESRVLDVPLISQDPAVFFLTGNTVKLLVSIQAESRMTTFGPLDLKVRGLAPGLGIAGILPAVTATLTGNPEAMKNVTMESLEPIVDLGQVSGPGSYLVSVTLAVPEGVTVQNLFPPQIPVTVWGQNP